MQRWLIGACTLLTAAGARAEELREPHSKVGAWEIAAEPERKLCKMFRVYGSSTDSHVEGLFVRYDAANEEVWVTWSTDEPIGLPTVGETNLLVEFAKGKSLNGSWGNRLFKYRKPAATYYFSHKFTGPKNAHRMLRHLSTSDVLGLSLGSAMMTGLSLDAFAATEALRECSTKVAGLGVLSAR